MPRKPKKDKKSAAGPSLKRSVIGSMTRPGTGELLAKAAATFGLGFGLMSVVYAMDVLFRLFTECLL